MIIFNKDWNLIFLTANQQNNRYVYNDSLIVELLV